MTSPRWDGGRSALIVLLLLAWALRWPPLLSNRFHPDEALYGYWGLLIGRGQNPWLTGVPVYKPPVLPYLMAAAQALVGRAELAERLLGLAAGLLAIPLVARLTNVLYRDQWTTVVAVTAMSLSPFAILFSATAFTDPLMVVLGVSACVAAAVGRSWWAGALTGLSFATKQIGVVFLPLVAAMTLTRFSSRRGRILRLLAAFSLVIVSTFVWDSVRVARGAQSFWREGIAGYGGLRLIWSTELWKRLREWTGVAQYLFASLPANCVLLTGLAALTWNAVVRRRHQLTALVDLLFVGFSAGYFLVHWLLAFPVWDRYLLPLLPPLSILLGRSVHFLAQAIARRISLNGRMPRHTWTARFPHLSAVCCCLALFVALLSPARHAANSSYPLGGDHGAYDGIDEIAAFGRGLPTGSVVYQHWLGWQYGYYLYDAPVFLAYWPTPAWLAQDVQAFGAKVPRYIAFPSWELPDRVVRALNDRGFSLETVLTTTRRDGTPSFTVHRIRSGSNR